MNQDLNGNMKLFWKEMNKANGGKEESCTRIKDGNGRLERLKCEGFGRSISMIFII